MVALLTKAEAKAEQAGDARLNQNLEVVQQDLQYPSYASNSAGDIQTVTNECG